MVESSADGGTLPHLSRRGGADVDASSLLHSYGTDGQRLSRHHQPESLDQWLLQDQENCLLTDTAASCLAETIERGLTDHALRQRITGAALEDGPPALYRLGRRNGAYLSIHLQPGRGEEEYVECAVG